MKFEIEMLSVGDADASIVRFYNENNHEYIILIDAGNPSDGLKVINNINTYTKQKYIDLAICTHPDKDHIGGFFDIVKTLKINEFWIHDPSQHVDLQEVKKSVSAVSLYKSLRFVTESFDDSKNLLDMIDKKGIPRKEPFTGLIHSSIPITIVGPTVKYYEELLANFRNIEHLFKEAEYFEKSLAGEVIIEETLSPTLDEKDDKSSENSSSAICAFMFDEKKYLFTADATPDALTRAKNDYNLSNVNWLQVPHHGSKYNLNSELIKHFNPNVAYVSASGSKKYPSQAVVNALKKVGCKVFSTAKANMLHNSIDDRDGYSTATPL